MFFPATEQPEQTNIVDGMALQAPKCPIAVSLEQEDTSIPAVDEYDCSCISYMRSLGHDFPKVPDPSYLEPNSLPAIGGIILLDFNQPHIAEIMDFRKEVLFYKERILEDGECITRVNWIRYDNPAVRGFRND